MLKLNKHKTQIVDEVITYWEDTHLLTPAQSQQLRASYYTPSFDWKLLALYAFWIAVTCVVLSAILLIADDYLMSLVAILFNTPASILSGATALFSIACYVLAVKRRNATPQKKISNAAIFFLGGVLTASSSAFLSQVDNTESWRDSLFVALPTCSYLLLGVALSAHVLWLGGLLGGGLLLLIEGNVLSQTPLLGMNIPLQFLLFGLLIIAMSFQCYRHQKLMVLGEVTRFTGQLYFFTSLWLLTIFGHYQSLQEWNTVAQSTLWPWALFALLCCTITIVLGVKYNDIIARTFGMAFTLIVLYTEYIVLFWERIHHALFFAILAATFWLIGLYAEKIWQKSGMH